MCYWTAKLHMQVRLSSFHLHVVDGWIQLSTEVIGVYPSICKFIPEVLTLRDPYGTWARLCLTKVWNQTASSSVAICKWNDADIFWKEGGSEINTAHPYMWGGRWASPAPQQVCPLSREAGWALRKWLFLWQPRTLLWWCPLRVKVLQRNEMGFFSSPGHCADILSINNAFTSSSWVPSILADAHVGGSFGQIQETRTDHLFRPDQSSKWFISLSHTC